MGRASLPRRRHRARPLRKLRKAIAETTKSDARENERFDLASVLDEGSARAVLDPLSDVYAALQVFWPAVCRRPRISALTRYDLGEGRGPRGTEAVADATRSELGAPRLL